MVELIALLIVIIVVITLIRPRKPLQLDTPIIIQRDQFHITLAPQLSRAQTLIENIARRVNATPDAKSATLCFEVGNPSDSPYLLAITRRSGTLYCQAILPRPLLRDRDSHFQQLMEFSKAVMVNIPEEATGNSEGNYLIIRAANSVAQEEGISIRQMLP